MTTTSSTAAWFDGLPAPVEDAVRHAPIVEWASTTRAGMPVSTALLMFPNPVTRNLDVTTGVAYPVKAERARHNPAVGLAISPAGPGHPLVVVSARAAVRDADLQANTDRFLEVFAPLLEPISGGAPWSVCREALWYWARIFIENEVATVRWWPDGLERPAHRWDAPPTTAPRSDPAPAARLTAAPAWPRTGWQTRATEVLDDGTAAWLTVHDADQYPLPFPITTAERSDDGFRLEIPRGHPWPAAAGPASLVWPGRATFVGHLNRDSDTFGVAMRVERLVADLPMARDGRQTFLPEPEVRERLLRRLANELARRRQQMPALPVEAPNAPNNAQSPMLRVGPRAEGPA